MGQLKRIVVGMIFSLVRGRPLRDGLPLAPLKPSGFVLGRPGLDG